MKQSKFGFTLIELLIVIALLGSLAVGLLAALDPFEQLKKGTDTGVRNTASELQGAAIRFYAIRGYMPWCTDPAACTDPVSGTTLVTFTSAVDNMIKVGELKSNFMDLAAAYQSKIYVTGSSDPDNPSMIVCYNPQSKAFQADANTKYTNAGGAASNCRGHGAGTALCYWCVM